MAYWDPDLGIWSWWVLRGSTPRNAGNWTLDIHVGKYALWTGSGKHAYVNLYKGPKEVWGWERKSKKCDCYGCNVVRPPTSEEWEVLCKGMQDPDAPRRKLSPRASACTPLGLPSHMCATCGEPWYYDQPVCLNPSCKSHNA